MTRSMTAGALSVKRPFLAPLLPTAMWMGLAVLPNGEARPGVRSPEVWAVGVKETR